MTDQLFPVEPEATPSPTEKSGTRPAYPQWDALVELFGPARTPTTRTLYGKIAAELRHAGYTQPEIMLAARIYRGQYEGISFTATALLKHIDQLIYEASKETQKRDAAAAPRLVVLPDLEAI